MNILDAEIWKPLSEETAKLQFTLNVLVATYTEHTWSRNMEATFRGNISNSSSLQFLWLLYLLNILGPEI